MSGNVEHRVVYLNVGGKKFTTASYTLLEHGKAYFTRLLGIGEEDSGVRFDRVCDKDGALFIDREGAYFEVLLRYMRTGQLSVPEGIHYTTLRQEAEYYSMYSLVDLMDERLSAAKDFNVHTSSLRHDGFYVHGSGQERIAVSFRVRNRMFYTVGKDASEVMSAFLLVRVTPKSWEVNARHTATKFASFVTARVHRGVYWFDGHHLHLRTVGPHQATKTYWPGIFANPDVLLPQFTNDPVNGPLFGAEDWATGSWLRFTFLGLPKMDFGGVLHHDEISDDQLEITVAP